MAFIFAEPLDCVCSDLRTAGQSFRNSVAKRPESPSSIYPARLDSWSGSADFQLENAVRLPWRLTSDSRSAGYKLYLGMNPYSKSLFP